MKAETAAAYLDMGQSTFLVRVKDGTLPQPTINGGLGRCVRWSKIRIDEWIEEREDTSPNNTGWHKYLNDEDGLTLSMASKRP